MNIGWLVLLSLSATALTMETAPATCNASVSLIHVDGPQTLKQELRNVRQLSQRIENSKKFFLGKNKLFNKVYGKIMFGTGSFQYSWLPRNHSHWFKQTIQCMGKTEKWTILLPVLFDSLHNFTVSYEYMKTYEPLEENYLQEYRQIIINFIISVLKPMLCDVEIMLLNRGITPPVLKPAASILPATWMNGDDKEDRLKIEWGIHKLYKKFMEHWDYILKDLVRKKDIRRCNIKSSKYRYHSMITDAHKAEMEAWNLLFSEYF